MKENTLENACIYYKNAKGLKFEKREHIIPAFLGGKIMLDQGVVSDQANELFSGIEKHVSMESGIMINRMFLGPGKRGSKNPKKVGSVKIGVMSSSSHGDRPSLGYIVMGKPKSIIQCIIRRNLDNKEVQMILDADQMDNFSSKNSQFWDELIMLNVDTMIYIPNDKISENELLLGTHKGKWFLAYNKALDRNVVKQDVREFVHKISGHEIRIDDSKMYKVKIKNPLYNYKSVLDVNKYLRFCAKIAFNVSTFLNGKEFMLNKCFDNIREAILTGKNIDDYVRINSVNPYNTFIKLDYESIYGRSLHSVICFSNKEGYFGVVSFYGFVTSVLVKLSNPLNQKPIMDLNGYFCDWENGKEYKLIDFIAGLNNENG